MAGELSDVVKAQKDLLWGMYTDVRAHARHAETLRSNVVNFMVVVASVLIAVIANDARVSRPELPLSLAIVLVGLLGIAFAASYTELHERNRKRAMRLRAALDDEFFSGGCNTIASLLDEADEPHEAGRLYRWSRGLTGSTQRFWFLLPALILASGLLLTIAAL
jgi:hypothetical protein